MKQEKKRILHVNIDNNGGNGAYSLVRNLYSLLSDKYIFDYYTMGEFVDDEDYRKVISCGGRCYSAGLRKNRVLGHIKLSNSLRKVIENGQYEIVHIHSEVAYKHFFYALASSKCRCRKIIIHSHSSSIDGDHVVLKRLLHCVFKNEVNRLGTDFLACSMPAAEWMFTKRNLKRDCFHILQNGINIDRFVFSEIKRNEMRKALGIDGCKVIGHVGSLKKVKNQAFLIDIIQILKNQDYVLMLIGDGEDKEKLLAKARKLDCESAVIFMGSKSNVCDYLQAMDVFVMPSFFEGIPMSLLEAQTTGLPIIASSNINNDIKVNDNLVFCSLESGMKSWIDLIVEYNGNHLYERGYENMKKSKFNIRASADLLRKVYG